jgi:hypothetical protein
MDEVLSRLDQHCELRLVVRGTDVGDDPANTWRFVRICTVVAPDAVYTFRKYATCGGY